MNDDTVLNVLFPYAKTELEEDEPEALVNQTTDPLDAIRDRVMITALTDAFGDSRNFHDANGERRRDEDQPEG